MERYLEASLNGNDRAAFEETCEEHWPLIVGINPFQPETWEAEYEVDEAVVDGNRATVRVRIDGRLGGTDGLQDIDIDEQFEMRKDFNTWLVCDPRLSGGIWGYLEVR